MQMRGLLLFALLPALSFSQAEDTYCLPSPPGVSGDAVVLLLQDGLLPEVPWEGLSDSQREEFWTLGFRGILVQRFAWAGYVISGPPGSSGKLLEYARSLSGPQTVQDGSIHGNLLDMIPLSGCGPVVILFTDSSDSHWPPDSLPLRMSLWLTSGPDTLITSGDWGGSVFMLTSDKDPDAIDWSAGSGAGYQPVPLESGSAVILVAPVSGGTPSDIGEITVSSHPGDTALRDPWLAILERMDNIVLELAPPVFPGDYLIWFRGNGSDGRLALWTALPSPAPPAVARSRIDMPDIADSPWNPVPPAEALHESISVIEFPGTTDSGEMGMILAGIIERMIGRDRSMLPVAVEYYSVEPLDDGRLALYLGWNGEPAPGSGIIDGIAESLAPLVLSVHDDVLTRNATVRASIRLGRELDTPGNYRLSRELGSVLGIL
jgi:hypothetical protein